jgi:hypothetical protein
MKSRKLIRVARIAVFGTTILLLAGFGSCSTSVQDICARKLPAFDEQVGGALGRLGRGANVRGLASVGAPHGLDGEQREQWLKWTEQRLSEAQRYMDTIDGYQGQKEVQRELSEIATELVQFHGYARQGREDRMARTLERIQVRSARARGLACTPAKAQ